MDSQKEEEKRSTRPQCLWLVIVVVVLLLVVGYLAMRNGGSKIVSPIKAVKGGKGGNWTAKGGCACAPPPN